MTQQGRMATLPRFASLQQCLTLPLRLKCLCPSKNSSTSFLGFAVIPLFSGLLFLVFK